MASRELGGLLAAKGIELVTEFSTGTVQATGEPGRGGRLVSYDDREVPFDLAVIVPLHGGADYVGRSPGLGDELVGAHDEEGISQPAVRDEVDRERMAVGPDLDPGAVPRQDESVPRQMHGLLGRLHPPADDPCRNALQGTGEPRVRVVSGRAQVEQRKHAAEDAAGRGRVGASRPRIGGRDQPLRHRPLDQQSLVAPKGVLRDR